MKKQGRKLVAFITVLMLLAQGCISGFAAELPEDLMDQAEASEVNEEAVEETVYDEAAFASEPQEEPERGDLAPGEEAEPYEDASVSEDTVSGNEGASECEGSDSVSDGSADYVYDPKDYYDLVFVADNNGDRKERRYNIPASTASITVGEFLNNKGAYSDIIPSMGGFLDIEDEDQILYWSITRDGTNYGTADDLNNFYIMGGYDYTFTAHLCRRAAENIYVEITPKVYYDGRYHILCYGEDSKKNNADVFLDVVFHNDAVAGAVYRELTYGKDYTVSYKNNQKPSMEMSFGGSYMSKVAKEERPCITINGKGNYSGFSADAYFDILPYNFSSDYPYPLVKLNGLKKLYALKDGKLTEKIDIRPTVTWSEWIKGKDVEWSEKLTLDKDYSGSIYRYDAENNVWLAINKSDPNIIDQPGDYLYVLSGKDRFCGRAFDETYNGEFSDGKASAICPEHFDYTGTEIPASAAFQFRVAGDVFQDLSNATISIGKSSIKFDGKFHTGDDFKLKVTIGKGKEKRTLTEGTDYTVTYDGEDFTYVSERVQEDGVWLYRTATCNAIYDSKIGIANKYKVTIKAVDGGGYYGTKAAGKTVTIKGINLTNKGFAKSKTLVFNGKNSSEVPTVSRYGLKSGLTYYSAANLGFDSSNKCMYLDNLNSNPGYYSQNYYAVLYDHYNAAPGPHQTKIFAVGGGVTHGKSLVLIFTRKKISLKKAVQNGYVSLSIDPGEYNAGGAFPGAVKVTFCGVTGGAKTILYNGQEIYTPFTNEMQTSFKVKASGNKKAGDGAVLTLSNSSYFTGSYKFKYSIKPITLSQTTIPLVDGNSWYRDKGSIEGNTLSGKYYAMGQLVAVMNEAKKNPTGAPLKPGVKLYQTYYKNESDLTNNKLSLAEIKSNQYQFAKASEADGACTLEARFSGTPKITGFEIQTLPIDGTYSEYETAAKIVGATVFYNGQTYEFGSKSKISIPYEGRQIRFDRETGDGKGVISVTLSDGTKLGKDDFYVVYGSNLAAKKNGGSFKVILKRNDTKKTFRYGGSATFKFTIDPAKGITM